MNKDETTDELRNGIVVLDEKISQTFYKQTLLTGSLLLLIGILMIPPYGYLIILLGILTIVYCEIKIFIIQRRLRALTVVQ